MKCLLFIVALIATSFVNAETKEEIWIDVRSFLEHAIDNIDGDPRIPAGDISEKVDSLFPDRDTKIRLYCRSGVRAQEALSLLKAQGYEDVENVGSIQNARKLRGLEDE